MLFSPAVHEHGIANGLDWFVLSRVDPPALGDNMRLAKFIKSNTEAILAEWVEFASQSGAAGKAMDVPALRDHVREMLGTIVRDLETRQTEAERSEKSKGR